MLKSNINAEFRKSVKQKGIGTYKNSPPPIITNLENFVYLLKRESTTLSGPPGGLNGEINSHYINHNTE